MQLLDEYSPGTHLPLVHVSWRASHILLTFARVTPAHSPLPADVVVFLKDGSRLELAGLERFQEIVDYIESQRRKL